MVKSNGSLDETTDSRLARIVGWLRDDLRLRMSAIEPASDDASFRRYFRVIVDHRDYIVMDAPVERENCEPFVRVRNLLEQAGVKVPALYRYNRAEGFLLLEDFGSTCYLERLDQQRVGQLYGDALQALLRLQQRIDVGQCGLPLYQAERFQTEMRLFDEWFIEQLLEIELSAAQRQLLRSVEQQLVASAVEQPQVCVHRDYHSRNLMVLECGNLGVIDFQDALIGPITYDLVSLLRDCYIRWPQAQVAEWCDGYWAELKLQQMLSDSVSCEQFRQWFDWMGIQRHLKAIGIFSRLKLRDNKPGYIKDIPRTVDYLLDVCERYSVLNPFYQFLQDEVVNRIDSAAVVE